MIRPAVTLCLGLLLATIACADDVPFKPYPDASVTAEQITAYQSQVKSAFGDTEQERAAEQAVMYFDSAKRTQYIFTLPANPAHPGCIVRRIVTRSSVSNLGFLSLAAHQTPPALISNDYQY